MLMYNPSRQDAGCGEVPLTEETIPEGEETCETGGWKHLLGTGRSRRRKREATIQSDNTSLLLSCTNFRAMAHTGCSFPGMYRARPRVLYYTMYGVPLISTLCMYNELAQRDTYTRSGGRWTVDMQLEPAKTRIEALDKIKRSATRAPYTALCTVCVPRGATSRD